MASLVIAFAARKIARRPADERMTFGYGRIEIVAALINYKTLILVGVYLIYEGGMRIIDPPEVQGWTVVILGGVALVVDALTAALTWSMQKGSVNIRALFLHNLSDALASVAVIAGGSLIILYDMRWVDPAITIGIALYILYLAFTEIGGPIRTLMLGSPPELDCGAVIDAMRGIDGVEDVHHVHLWQMHEHEAALDCHVVITTEGWARIEATSTVWVMYSSPDARTWPACASTANSWAFRIVLMSSRSEYTSSAPASGFGRSLTTGGDVMVVDDMSIKSRCVQSY